LARQNQKLIGETADMHYNLGVFYVQSTEYGRAIKEFEKALDLNSDNADANYNLGFIYAEHLVDREKAIQYFRNYLTYAPDAKDAEWIRKYILTWQTWYGKQPIK
jgi:tetratricopeptide (TPR) repeat protein